MKSNLLVVEYQGFEDIKHVDEEGNEYWLARELALVLGYVKWENFQKVLQRATIACSNSGYNVEDQFPEVRKLVQHGSGAKRDIKDYRLTRYACYLIVQNGDPRKEVIAKGQSYFAIQTHKQEVLENMQILDEDKKRVVIRNNIKQLNQLLSESAYNSGVKTTEEFANFQNSGYTGLYNGETVKDIHVRKGLEPKEKILDYMNSSELAANMFRISLTDERLRKEKINNSIVASDAHFEIGKRVRQTIEDVGGILPEKQPTPKSSITQIERKMLNEMMKDPNKMLDE